MGLLYIFCIILILGTIVSLFLLASERRKQKNNPIPKLRNHDKRFGEIDSVYSQKMVQSILNFIKQYNLTAKAFNWKYTG